MVYKNKSDNRTTPPGNLVLIEIYNHIILVLGDYVLLGGFKLRDEVLNIYGADEIIVEFRYDEYFIL